MLGKRRMWGGSEGECLVDSLRFLKTVTANGTEGLSVCEKYTDALFNVGQGGHGCNSEDASMLPKKDPAIECARGSAGGKNEWLRVRRRDSPSF